MSALETAHAFIRATAAKDAGAAAELCDENVEIFLPGAEVPIRGKDGVREMIRLAPEFEQSFRDSEVQGDEVRVRTLTRAPGIFANYTTWVFETQEGKVRRLTFELKAAN